MFIFHNYFVLTIPSMWNLLCMKVSTTWQLWLLDCIHLSQNVWCYTGDTCVCVLCECVYDWLSMLVELYMLCGRGLQHSICALPNPFSCKWNKICLNQFGVFYITKNSLLSRWSTEWQFSEAECSNIKPNINIKSKQSVFLPMMY